MYAYPINANTLVVDNSKTAPPKRRHVVRVRLARMKARAEKRDRHAEARS